jgi:hypothetical protein
LRELGQITRRRSALLPSSSLRNASIATKVSGGLRFRMAMVSASSQRVLFRRPDIDQPTTSMVARSFTAPR